MLTIKDFSNIYKTNLLCGIIHPKWCNLKTNTPTWQTTWEACQYNKNHLLITVLKALDLILHLHKGNNIKEGQLCQTCLMEWVNLTEDWRYLLSTRRKSTNAVYLWSNRWNKCSLKSNKSCTRNGKSQHLQMLCLENTSQALKASTLEVGINQLAVHSSSKKTTKRYCSYKCKNGKAN